MEREHNLQDGGETENPNGQRKTQQKHHAEGQRRQIIGTELVVFLLVTDSKVALGVIRSCYLATQDDEMLLPISTDTVTCSN